MEDLNGKQITTSKARCNWLPDRAWAVKIVDVIALRSDRLAVHEATDPSRDSRPRTRNEPCVWKEDKGSGILVVRNPVHVYRREAAFSTESRMRRKRHRALLRELEVEHPRLSCHKRSGIATYEPATIRQLSTT